MPDTAVSTELKAFGDIPILAWETMEGRSSYEVFRELRAATPLVRVPIGMGYMTMALHARAIELVVSDATRQIETETKMMQGIFNGPIYDFTANVLLFSNGDVHMRRRRPIARTFAYKLMEAMRGKSADTAAELINERLGKGIKPENNGYALFWSVFGPEWLRNPDDVVLFGESR